MNDRQAPCRVVVPCRDEELTVAGVVEGFLRQGAEVVVYDNDSTDATAENARRAGAEVRPVAERGKGNVVRQALADARREGIERLVLVDGDATYDADALGPLLDCLDAGNEMAYAARIGRGEGRYRPGHWLGNRLLATILTTLHGRAPSDPLTGYRALAGPLLRDYRPRVTGFTIETEMNQFVLGRGRPWGEIDAPYGARPEGSSSKLNTLRDGVRILATALLLGLGDLFRPDDPGPTRPVHLLGAAAVGVLGALALTPLLLLANLWWARSDPEPLAAELRRALPNGSAESPEGTLRDSAESFNDCLIPYMTVDRTGSTAQLTVSARRIYRLTRPQDPCTALEQVLWQGGLADDYRAVFYHPYWNGQRVLVQMTVPYLGVTGLKAVLRGGTLLLLLVGSLWAAATLVRGAAAHRWQALALLSICLAFWQFADLERRIASFTAAPSNLVCLVLMLTLVCLDRAGPGSGRLWSRIARAPLTRTLLLAGSGALLGYLALFFGTVLIGLVWVLLLAATRPLPDERVRLRLALQDGAAIAVGIVTSLALHAVLAGLAFDGAVALVLDQLHHRMTGAARSSMSPELNELFVGREVSWGDLTVRLDRHVWRLGWGNQLAGRSVAIGAVVLSFLLPLLGLIRAVGSRIRWLVLLACAAAAPLWYALFLEHSITHAGVMVRLLHLNVAVALLACSGLVLEQATRSGPR